MVDLCALEVHLLVDGRIKQYDVEHEICHIIHYSVPWSVIDVAPNSFSAVVHHMCEANYMKQVWVKDNLQYR